MQPHVVVKIGIVPEQFLYAIEEGSTGLGCISRVNCRCIVVSLPKSDFFVGAHKQ